MIVSDLKISKKSMFLKIEKLIFLKKTKGEEKGKLESCLQSVSS